MKKNKTWAQLQCSCGVETSYLTKQKTKNAWLYCKEKNKAINFFTIYTYVERLMRNHWKEKHSCSLFKPFVCNVSRVQIQKDTFLNFNYATPRWRWDKFSSTCYFNWDRLNGFKNWCRIGRRVICFLMVDLYLEIHLQRVCVIFPNFWVCIKRVY